MEFDIHIGDTFEYDDHGECSVEGFTHYGPSGWFCVCVGECGEAFELDTDSVATYIEENQ
jgi:ferredoxin